MPDKQIPMGACCLSGVLAQGKPQGRVEQIGGLDVYVTEPASGSKEKTIIFLTDIFGWNLPNVRLSADQYADAGFCVYIPDLHQGDSLPMDFLATVEPPLAQRGQLSAAQKAFNTAETGAILGPWLIKHRENVTKPLVDGFINTVKYIPGTDKIGVVGFCWGGRYAILTAHDPIQATYVCHPALIAIPSDFDDVTRPMSLAFGAKDGLLGKGDADKIEAALKQRGVEVEIQMYEDQVHGFALRSDFSSDKDKEAMDAAQRQGVAWFRKHLT